MLTIHVWPRRLKEFLLTHPLYKSPLGGFNNKISPVAEMVAVKRATELAQAESARQTKSKQSKGQS